MGGRRVLAAFALALVLLPSATVARSAQTPPGTPTAADNPFAGARGYVEPDSPAQRQAESWRDSRPADAALIDKIAAQPTATWFGVWNDDVRADVDEHVSAVVADGALPVLVAYNIPHLDCAAAGAADAEAYRAWIDAYATGIGDRPAVVVLEPDALPSLQCLSAEDQALRLEIIGQAVATLEQRPNVAVYVDAGHANWVPAEEMARRLAAANVAAARGFSLNVSNFGFTDDNIRFGREVSTRTGGKPFIIDTSRNGLGPTPDAAWCNPPDRAVGTPFTTATADPLVDAYYWIKRPGESDGTCNGGPPAGEWWPEYALGLAERAAF